jgi:hypothetical protein
MTTKSKARLKRQSRPISYTGSGVFEREMQVPVWKALQDLQYRVEKALHVAEGLPYQGPEYAEPIVRKMARILVGQRNIWPLAAARLHGPIRISYYDNERMSKLMKSMEGASSEELQRRIVQALEIARDSNGYPFYTDARYFIDLMVQVLAEKEYGTVISSTEDWLVGYKPKKYRLPRMPVVKK